jgi:hypothetical protein
LEKRQYRAEVVLESERLQRPQAKKQNYFPTVLGERFIHRLELGPLFEHALACEDPCTEAHGSTSLYCTMGYYKSRIICTLLQFPIGARAVVGMDFGGPALIGHRGPVVLIKPGGVLQPLLRHIKNKPLVVRIQR